MGKPSEISKQNIAKYGKPPTWEQIDSVIKESGMYVTQFELLLGIPFNHLFTVKSGYSKLFSDYWHIFYEKVLDTPFEEKLITKRIGRKAIKIEIKKRVPLERHGRLSQIK